MQRLTTLFGLIVLTGMVPCLAQGPTRAAFTTEDGVNIVGSYYKPPGHTPRPAVILLHMYRSDRTAWEPLVEVLQRKALAVLAIDMRGHGQSVQPTSMGLQDKVMRRDGELFRSTYRDVMAAYTWLSRQPNVDLSRLGVVGASVGCSVAIDYAARDRSVDAVVCMTPGEDYLGLDSRKHIAEFAKYGQRPTLLLATEGERKACDVLGKIDESATVRIVGRGKVHGTHMFGKIEGIEDQIAQFLHKHLGTPSEKPVAAAVDGSEYFDVDSVMDISLESARRRLFSSPQEAEARGLEQATGPEAMRTHDRHDRDVRPWPPIQPPPEGERKKRKKDQE